MRPLKLSEEQKMNIYCDFLSRLETTLNNYNGEVKDDSITVKTGLNSVASDKITIKYTREAYLRMQALVDSFNTEVMWYGLSEKTGEKEYKIYDVRMCKQYVTGTKVDTEDEDTLEFYDELSEEELNHLRFQAHSHVRMSTSPSGTDTQNQQDIVQSLSGQGYYIFQIWNKSGDINTCLYDIDGNTYYDRKDIDLVIEDSMGSLKDFVSYAETLVLEKKYPYQTYYPQQKKENYAGYTKEEQEIIKEMYSDYYNGYVWRGDYY